MPQSPTVASLIALSVHGVQHLLKKHSANAARVCPSLKGKRVTVHLLRHTMALELLQAGVDRRSCGSVMNR